MPSPASTAGKPGSSVRRDGITVGGLSSTDSTVAYDSVGMWGGSSQGGMDIRIGGTVRSQAASLIDLVAPACYTRHYYSTSPGVSSYFADTETGGCGTSYAAPSVAGAAADVVNSMYQLGWTGMTARGLQTYMLMMGSGWNADAGTVYASGMNAKSGAGRLHNHFMSSGNLTSPWAWSCHAGTISQGQTIAYPVYASGYVIPASVTTWKSALTWEEDDLWNAADLDLWVYNTCPSGGGAPVSVNADASYDIRARLRQTDAAGKCLEYRIVGYTVPAGQTRSYTVCDYFQSGSAADN